MEREKDLNLKIWKSSAKCLANVDKLLITVDFPKIKIKIQSLIPIFHSLINNKILLYKKDY